MLTREQQLVLEYGENVFVSACPGSGKTRTIISKIAKELSCVVGTSRKIACITHTNAAVDEIVERLSSFASSSDQEHVEVGTIHSFCLGHILRPFHRLLDTFSAGEFEIVSDDGDAWKSVVDLIIDRHKLDPRSADNFNYIIRYEDRDWNLPRNISRRVAEDFCAELDSRRYVALNDIIFHSNRLLDQSPFIASSIGSRFTWILVDEFQDTSLAQLKLLNKIHSCGRTKLFLVGDKNQSIFTFAGADPELSTRFAEHVGAREMNFTGNFRCSRQIVTDANNLIPITPSMEAVGPYAGYSVRPKRVVASSFFEAVINDFFNDLNAHGISHGDAAILAPTWWTLYGLSRQLRNRGITSIGPGSRPYSSRCHVAFLFEYIASLSWHHNSSRFRKAQRSMFYMINSASGETNWNVMAFEGRKVLVDAIRASRTLLRRGLTSASAWIPAFSHELTNLLQSAELIDNRVAVLLQESASTMAHQIATRTRDETHEFDISQLALFAHPEEFIKLMTIHGSKGKEFDAVALIDIHEGRIPHSFSPEIEGRRLFYVGITRAKKILHYVTLHDQVDSPLLDQANLVSS